MIYLDNSATTFKKPAVVYKAMNKGIRKYSANAGRGGHKLSLLAGGVLVDSADSLAELFGIENPEGIAFTNNATTALNYAIKGSIVSGDKVIVSGYEHNSVIRPLHKIGAEIMMCKPDQDGVITAENVKNIWTDDIKLVVINHASNVSGIRADIDGIGTFLKDKESLFLVDTAQSAGNTVIDVKHQHIDMLAFTGHKGLYGPMGTGGLYVKDGIALDTIVEGGTGSMSESVKQPDFMPDRFQSGTINVPAIYALNEGVRFVLKEGVSAIEAYEKSLCNRMFDRLMNMQNVSMIGIKYPYQLTNIVSFNLEGKDSVEVANRLSEDFGICVRAGQHCAPIAHKTLGTGESGCVRLSVSYLTKMKEVMKAVDAINKIGNIPNGY